MNCNSNPASCNKAWIPCGQRRQRWISDTHAKLGTPKLRIVGSCPVNPLCFRVNRLDRQWNTRPRNRYGPEAATPSCPTATNTLRQVSKREEVGRKGRSYVVVRDVQFSTNTGMQRLPISPCDTPSPNNEQKNQCLLTTGRSGQPTTAARILSFLYSPLEVHCTYHTQNAQEVSEKEMENGSQQVTNGFHGHVWNHSNYLYWFIWKRT
jgi:hypothetical protein